jgi:hypothetical protein
LAWIIAFALREEFVEFVEVVEVVEAAKAIEG